VPVEALEAVTVRHYTSRAGDPHRHLHLQIGARVFAAGKWCGLHTVGVRDSLGAINGIGHAAVACDPLFRAALAAHGYTLDATGEILELSDFVGPFSARAAQIGRNAERYEAEWAAAHPGDHPGPALRRAWDARAWAEGRPDKITPQPGTELTARWRAELAALGYRDPSRPVALAPSPIGALDRDRAAEQVITRLAAGRSAWNPADIRGEVEQLIAAARIVADASVRIGLAEDLTARALACCVPLLSRDGMPVPVPEHIRAWTSQPVLDVEADLVDRLAASGSEPSADAAKQIDLAAGGVGRLDAGQAVAVAALTADRSLIVLEGAAGAGKTTTLSAARHLLEEQGRRLVVVTPTLKAAKVASAEVGTAAGSAAWLVFQHGWRWEDSGGWIRLSSGQVDPVTGRDYAGPEDRARLHAGDILVVDEAGMLDQDTARALLTVADESRTRVALIGDRHQLSAVGRGGVLDLAARYAAPDACLTLGAVHRFTRTVPDADGTRRAVPDADYAELTLAMRRGEEPRAVFDALSARSNIRLHADPAALRDALTGIAVASYRESRGVAVVVDTRKQAAEVNEAIRERLVADGRVDDARVITTQAGQRIGAGDRIATRRNNRSIDVANRDTWTVTRVGRHGELTVTPTDDDGPDKGERMLPEDYVARHVELAYASTAHGVQGDTVAVAHVVIGEHTGAASAYVGMTRGRTANTAHLVAADLAEAREQWIAVFSRDRADLGPGHAADLAAREAVRYAGPRPVEEALADLRQAWTAEQRCLDRLAHHVRLRDTLRAIVALDSANAGQLTALEAGYRKAAVDAERARKHAEASAAVLTRETDRIRQTLLETWDSQRDTARAAARTVLEGPGRLRLRRAAVARAREQLGSWASTWRPHLPDLPADLGRVASFAARIDDRSRLWTAFDDHARRSALRAHPEHAPLQVAADAAALALEQAWRALAYARRQYEDRSARFDGRSADPAGQLAHFERDIAATTDELTAVRARIARLMAEPALLAQPPDHLVREREIWRVGHAADRVPRRPAAGQPAPEPGIHLPRPERDRQPVKRPGVEPGLGR
jgi:exodeoxyribonuclease V alpha subunit